MADSVENLELQKRIETSIVNAVEDSRLSIEGQIAQMSLHLEKVFVMWGAQKMEENHEGPATRVINATDDELLHKDRKRRHQADELLVRSLEFTHVRDRYIQIPKAHKATFDWIFHHDPNHTTSWNNFVEWLINREGREGLYWITGKAGSGKSTLMKHIFDDQRTKRYLRYWSGSKYPVVASCFFWNPGNKMQKSLIGLLRTLLSQLLPFYPDLTETVAPSRWQSYYDLEESRLPQWTTNELLNIFYLYFQKTRLRAKICLFIDGLDEYEGNDTARSRIIGLFSQISELENVKVCVSSRPWLIFKDAFDLRPSLLLEELTREDIKAYVEAELDNGRRFKKFRQRNPEVCNDLTLEIVTKAQGVFLWIFLVVRELLQGIQNEDSVYDLQRRLKAIPADLEEYFERMISTLEPFYFAEAHRTFQIALTAKKPLSLLTYSFIREPDSKCVVTNQTDAETCNVDQQMGGTYANRYIYQHHRGTTAYEYIEELSLLGSSSPDIETDVRLESMERRLNSLCKGLLEVGRTYRVHPFFRSNVDFLHRTARDFLLTGILEKVLGPPLLKPGDVSIEICKAFLTQLKSLERGEYYVAAFNELFGDFLDYAHQADAEGSRALISILDELDHFAQRRFISQGLISKPNHWTAVTPGKKGVELSRGHAIVAHEITFLNFAISEGLHYYVREKLSHSSQAFNTDSRLLRSVQETVSDPHQIELYESVMGAVQPPDANASKHDGPGQLDAKPRQQEVMPLQQDARPFQQHKQPKSNRRHNLVAKLARIWS